MSLRSDSWKPLLLFMVIHSRSRPVQVGTGNMLKRIVGMNSKLRQAFGQLLILASLRHGARIDVEARRPEWRSLMTGPGRCWRSRVEEARLEEWLYAQRAYRAEHSARGGREDARAVDANESESVQLFRTNGDPEPVWAPLGPEPILYGQTFGLPRNNVSGRSFERSRSIRGMTGARIEQSTLVGHRGGVWKSVDNGAHWSPITEDPVITGGRVDRDRSRSRQRRSMSALVRAAVARSAITERDAEVDRWRQHLDTDQWPRFTGPTQMFRYSATRPSRGLQSIRPRRRQSMRRRPSAIPGMPSIGQQLPISQVGLWRSGDGGATWSNLDPGGTRWRLLGPRCHCRPAQSE
jgi:hypothetical protein